MSQLQMYIIFNTVFPSGFYYIRHTISVYGLGSLAILVSSLSSMLGLFVYRWRNSPAYTYIICALLGLAVGALAGDAVLHLGPEVK